MSTIVVAIVTNKDRVLVARRRRKEGNLHWHFPSGAIEDGETESEAAEREVFEETDIECRCLRKLGGRVHPTTGRDVLYVACEYIAGSATAKDANALDQVEWMAPKKALRVITSSVYSPVRKFLEMRE